MKPDYSYKNGKIIECPSCNKKNRIRVFLKKERPICKNCGLIFDRGIRILFDKAETVIEDICNKNKGHNSLQYQCSILLKRKGEKVVAEKDILNTFVVSACSYSRMQDYFGIYSPRTICKLNEKFISKPFCGTPNLDYRDWENITLNFGNELLKESRSSKASNLKELVEKLKAENLSTNIPKNRIVFTLATGLPVVKKRIFDNSSAENFIKEYDEISKVNPGRAYDNAYQFQKNITQMGTPLVCDFFKNLGLLYYVKFDFHVKSFFEAINTFSEIENKIKEIRGKKEKKEFVLSWLLAKEIGMEPFFMDKILFIGGKYEKVKVKMIFNSYLPTYKDTLSRLVEDIPKYM